MKGIFLLLSGLFVFATTASAQTRPTVTLAITQPIVIEGQAGGGVLVVQRSEGIGTTLRVFYRVSGSARNGVDYVRLRGSVEIPAGTDQATIEIIPREDTRREPTERVLVQLRPTRQYRLGANRSQVIQIVDNDGPAVPRPPVNRPPPWFPIPGLIATNTTTTGTP